MLGYCRELGLSLDDHFREGLLYVPYCALMYIVVLCIASYCVIVYLQELRERVLRGKYRIPFYMSTDCENLLKKFLILNPTKRVNLEVRK